MRSDLDKTLAALADPTRRAVVELLRKGPQRPSDVAAILSISRPALSRHLRVLRIAGLVDAELVASDARARVLRLQRAPFTQLGLWADEVGAFGSVHLPDQRARSRPGTRPHR